MNKQKKMESVQQHIAAICCPYCRRSLQVKNGSLICADGHTFDLARQGYVNMLNRPGNQQYDKRLFMARQEIITASGLYDVLHQKIAKVVKEYFAAGRSSLFMLDAGCGEGSHLQRIIERSQQPVITGVGLDLSKEGIKLAAQSYKEPLWFVGDLAKSPFTDGVFDAILNILSPANYKEFQRLLAPDGIVIKVVPRQNYLKELREALFMETEKKVYRKQSPAHRFKEHFELVDVMDVSHVTSLNQAHLSQLALMSPLSWTAERERIVRFSERVTAGITIDLEIIVGRLKG
ncbi:methyltransferase domain-containing protein [Alkalihalobacillus oceani]|uniref:putative RNA methyltransferase n=1 Tax=Halalkalibacter oceani TaxID=1653776 RepID=UPI00204082F3|nr:methyltransferase domain-containing protein [Halalkalibacter oceani]MCM3761953.1 methyltransferase domain-containing protein [Halalkalibacter oceani]